MNDLRELSEAQGGVIYIEQFEHWLEEVVEQLEKVPTEYKDEEYNRAVWDVIRFLERAGGKDE